MIVTFTSQSYLNTDIKPVLFKDGFSEEQNPSLTPGGGGTC